MTVKVTVVVPVYNGARHVGRLLDSLARQSLPESDYEAILVDDGSTDATPKLLDRAAAEHPWLRVVHQPNSGWAGKPRNVGIDEARGDYVFFADHDDWLGDEALERLHATAVRTGADVVLGKMVGHGRAVPREVFRRNRDEATLADAPLVDSMTPHKLFRRAFLDEHRLRFPEERRRLEDHVFVMRAYLLADHVSIVADYDCYHHSRRDDDTNVSFALLEPAGYYRSVREVLDLVLAHTEPGPVRDRIFRRYLRVELLRRLDDDSFAAGSDYSAALWREVRDVLVTRYPPEHDRELAARQRLLCDLLRRDAYDDAVATVRWSRSVTATATGALTGSGVEIDLVVAAVDAPFVRQDDRRVCLDPPLRVETTADLEVTDELDRGRVDVVCRRDDGAERLVRAPVSFRAGGNGVLTGTATAQLASLPAGSWRVSAHLRVAGWPLDAPVQPRAQARRQLVATVADGRVRAGAARPPRPVLRLRVRIRKALERRLGRG